MNGMSEFENRLRELPVRGHSENLRTRIFSRPPRRARVGEVWRHPVRLGWAALLALVAGAAGFSANHVWERDTGPFPRDVRVEVRIVDAESENYNFDLSSNTSGFLFGDVSLEVEKHTEVGG